MLVEESIWIAEKIKEILPEEPFPVLNIGSSTLAYRTEKQPFIQNNIFNLFSDEKKQVIHLDMKRDDGIDLVGDLSDENFRRLVKELKPKLILCNNILMYLNKNTRKELSKILFEILAENGYLIITNSLVFPPSPDPVEAYYRATPEKIYKSLFDNFYLIDQNIAKTEYSFYKFLKSKPKLILIKLLRFFMPWYKSKEWWFMMKYYLFDLKKNYSSTCLFLRKK
ncbi:hypothetical protein [Cloacibacterium sp.]|uniref:hypothetical protein n=1 Tax=Cloacibacterium sp. TaxID=1913682 RepID=UPI0039E4D867